MRNINGILDYQKSDQEDVAAVVGADFTNATAVLLDIVGLSLPLLGYSTYAFEACISAGVSADVNGACFAVGFDGAAGANLEAQILGTLTAASAIAERIFAILTGTTALLTTVSQDGAIMIRGIITTQADPGNLTIQVNHPTAGTTTIYIGSYLRTVKVE